MFRYERAHRARLAAIFIPKFTWLPAEVVPTIVAFWADCGGHLPRTLNPSLPPTAQTGAAPGTAPDDLQHGGV